MNWELAALTDQERDQLGAPLERDQLGRATGPFVRDAIWCELPATSRLEGFGPVYDRRTVRRLDGRRVDLRREGA